MPFFHGLALSCFALFLLQFRPAGAETLQSYYVLAPHPSVTELVVTNKDSEAQGFYLLFDQFGIQERFFAVPAGEVLQIDLFKLLKGCEWAKLKLPASHQLEFEVTYESKGKPRQMTLTSLSSDSLETALPVQEDSKLILLNASALPNKVELSSGQTVEMEPYAVRKIPLKATLPSHFVRIKAEYPVTGYVEPKTSTPFVLPLLPGPPKESLPTPANDVDFLVSGEAPKDQSYILRLSDQEQIERARELIENKAHHVIWARLRAGHGGYNRDLSHSNQSHWSWHAELSEFSDFGLIGCDGSPRLIEEKLQDWLNSETPICFWSFQLEREIKPSEE